MQCNNNFCLLLFRLKHLQCNINRSRTNFDGGLGAFFNHVVEDEYVAVDAVIPMNTQLISLEVSNESLIRK